MKFVEAAMECFAAKGITATTVSDVTQTANVSRRTFYRYFSGKEALQEAVFKHCVDTIFSTMQTVLQPCADNTERMFEEVVAFASDFGNRDSDDESMQSTLDAVMSAMPLAMPKEWVAAWQRFFSEMAAADNESEVDGSDLRRLAGLAARLVAVYRQFGDSPNEIRESLQGLRVLSGSSSVAAREKRDERRRRNPVHLDETTGLFNQRYMQQALEAAIGERQNRGSGFGLLFINIDHFKTVNISLGQALGDQLLAGAGRRLEQCLEEGDLIGRHGADNFVVILRGSGSEVGVSEMAERMRSAFAEPLVIGGRRIYATLTVGAGLLSDTTPDWESLWGQAETAMHEGKRRGGDCVVLFSEGLERGYCDWATYYSALKHGLSHDEVHVVFQPRLDLTAGRLTVWEARARWRSETLGEVPPDTFFPIAESSDLIERLNNIVILKALAALADWHRQGHSYVRLAVKLSVREAYNLNCVSWLRTAVKDAGLAPESVEVEVTESVVTEDRHRGVAVLRRLAECGFHIAIDNFGTADSSLNHVSFLEADVLKIDKSLIDGIVSRERDAKIVESAIALGKSLDMKVVAEGIETREQLAFVTGLGCEMAQGLYLSKPVSGREAIRLIKLFEQDSTGGKLDHVHRKGR